MVSPHSPTSFSFKTVGIFLTLVIALLVPTYLFEGIGSSQEVVTVKAEMAALNGKVIGILSCHDYI